MSDKPDRIKAFTLDGLTNAIEKTTQVIHLKEIDSSHTFCVITQGETEYDITVLDPRTGLVRVKGGQFTEPIECSLTGSTLGGHMLWMGRIAIGMCMEFLRNGITTTTSPVKIIGWRIDPAISVSKAIN